MLKTRWIRRSAGERETNISKRLRSGDVRRPEEDPREERGDASFLHVVPVTLNEKLALVFMNSWLNAQNSG